MTEQKKNSDETLAVFTQAPQPERAKEKILIVDDVEENRFILREILKDDYDTDEAVNGKEAIEKIINRKIDYSLVLLDIMMPEMNGYEVLEALGKNGFMGRLPVILITAAGGGESEVKGIELGAVDYIAKPFYPRSVQLRIENQLELSKYRKHVQKLFKK